MKAAQRTINKLAQLIGIGGPLKHDLEKQVDQCGQTPALSHTAQAVTGLLPLSESAGATMTGQLIPQTFIVSQFWRLEV